MSDERIQLLTSSNAILSEGNVFATLKKTYRMGLEQIYAKAQALGTALALEPLSDSTVSGETLQERVLTEDETFATGMLIQPSRSERDRRDYPASVTGKVFAGLYAHTHQYRESQAVASQIKRLQDTIRLDTGRTVPVEVHEPLDPNLESGHQWDSFRRQRPTQRQYGPTQALTFYKGFFDQVILENREGLTDVEKLIALVTYLKENNQTLALPLVSMLGEKLFDSVQAATKILVKENMVTAIKLEPNRTDLPKSIPLADLLPFAQAAIQALPEDNKLYLLYEGRNASQDVPHLQNVLHIPALRT